MRQLLARRAPFATLCMLAGALALAACDSNSPIGFKLELSSGPEQTCPASSCLQIPLACDAVLAIRIIDPQAPLAPIAEVCEDLPAADNLCPISRVELPVDVIPNARLEFQVAVFAASAIPRVDGKPRCPSSIPFTPSGMPAALGTSPALGGRAFYSPGDEQTVVTLGCTDLTLIAPAACTINTEVGVTSTVNDFDTGIVVAPSVADTLALAVGEPRQVVNGITGQLEWVLASQNTVPLQRTVVAPVPGWSASLAAAPSQHICISIVEDGPQITSSVTCQIAEPRVANIDIAGTRLSRTTLGTILTAARLPLFPDDGMVIGMVRDYQGNPVAGATVRTTQGTVLYLNSARTGFVNGATTDNGIFISRDTEFGTEFSVANGTSVVIGGRLVGKVTIVGLELGPPVIQQ